MKRLGDDARQLLSASGMPDLGPLAAIVAAWPAAVGAPIARAAWPQRLGRDGTLYVTTTSAAWAFELGRLAPEVLARLRTAVGEEDVPGGLRFAPGAVPAPAAEDSESSIEPPRVAAEERAAGERLAAAIDDAELREMVARAAAASLARARSDRGFC